MPLRRTNGAHEKKLCVFNLTRRITALYQHAPNNDNDNDNNNNNNNNNNNYNNNK